MYGINKGSSPLHSASNNAYKTKQQTNEKSNNFIGACGYDVHGRSYLSDEYNGQFKPVRVDNINVHAIPIVGSSSVWL